MTAHLQLIKPNNENRSVRRRKAADSYAPQQSRIAPSKNLKSGRLVAEQLGR